MILADPAWSALLAIPTTDIAGQLVALDDRPLAESLWWANEIRSGLGSALKQVACQERASHCERCRRRGGCSFQRFWQPLRGDDERGPAYRTPPWILDVCLDRAQLHVHLRLLGPLTELAWQWRLALELAAARGLGRERRRFRFVPDDPAPRMSTLSDCCPDRPQPAPSLVMEMQSPLRLIEGGQPLTEAPSFSTVLVAADRRSRLAALSWLGVEISPLDRTWFDAARRLTTDGNRSLRSEALSRYSTRQRQSIPLAGLSGSVAYTGEWAPFWPLLRLAPALHIGKGATLGLGKVSFRACPSMGGPAPTSTGSPGLG